MDGIDVTAMERLFVLLNAEPAGLVLSTAITDCVQTVMRVHGVTESKATIEVLRGLSESIRSEKLSVAAGMIGWA